MEDIYDRIIADMNDVLVDADVEEPAGRGAGYRIEFDESTMVKLLKEVVPPGFVWINRPVRVRGDDFTYVATCLCSFPKTNGKVRYIVEDNGRLFIQRDSQLEFLADTPTIQDRMQSEGEIEEKSTFRKPPQFARGCPHCGYNHPPDGICLAPTEDPLGR